MDELRHLEMAKSTRSGEWGEDVPITQVQGSSMADDATRVGRTQTASGSDQRMKCAIGLISEQPRVAPGLLVPGGEVENVVPTRIGFQNGIGRMLLPDIQVRRGRKTDALNEASFRPINPAVEHEPPTLVPNHAPGPGCQVVPVAVRARMKCIVDHSPGLEIARDGVADRCVMVPQLRRTERTRSLEIKEVAVLAVPNVPKVPQPVVSQPKGHRS